MDEPKMVLENFLKCWQRRYWKKMLKYTELNWLGMNWDGEPNLNSNCMKALFAWKELKRWKIIEVIEKKSEKISYLVLIIYLFYCKIKVRRIKATLSFQSDITNRVWRVNPFSCLEEYTLRGEKAWK